MEKCRGIGVVAALLYGLCSTSMAFLNKIVITSYGFNFPFFIMACQMAVTIFMLEVGANLGWLTVASYTLKSGWAFALPSFAYGLHATLSLMALEGLNIPMYGAVKRCTPIVNLVLSVIVLKKPLPSCSTTASILLITAGCIIAALGDMENDAYAYSFGAVSVLAQGAYLTLVQRSAEHHQSSWDILLLNSYNTLGPFALLSLLAREPQQLQASPSLTEWHFHVTFWALALLGSVLNYSLFLCTAVNSALTTSIVGVAKSALQTLIGFFTFGGVTLHPINLLGILLNLVGGAMYAWLKWTESRPTAPQQTKC